MTTMRMNKRSIASVSPTSLDSDPNPKRLKKTATPVERPAPTGLILTDGSLSTAAHQQVPLSVRSPGSRNRVQQQVTAAQVAISSKPPLLGEKAKTPTMATNPSLAATPNDPREAQLCKAPALPVEPVKSLDSIQKEMPRDEAQVVKPKLSSPPRSSSKTASFSRFLWSFLRMTATVLLLGGYLQTLEWWMQDRIELESLEPTIRAKVYEETQISARHNLQAALDEARQQFAEQAEQNEQRWKEEIEALKTAQVETRMQAEKDMESIRETFAAQSEQRVQEVESEYEARQQEAVQAALEQAQASFVRSHEEMERQYQQQIQTLTQEHSVAIAQYQTALDQNNEQWQTAMKELRGQHEEQVKQLKSQSSQTSQDWEASIEEWRTHATAWESKAKEAEEEVFKLQGQLRKATMDIARLQAMTCTDEHEDCQLWAADGSCFTNPDFMRAACKKSCSVC